MASDVACRPAGELKAAASTHDRSVCSLDWLLLAGLLAGAVGAVFYRVVEFQFLTWDDDVHVTKNPLLDPVSFSNLAQFWLHPYENLYIPASYTFFAAEAWVSHWTFGRLDPQVFHAACLALHLACVWLVFRLLARMVENPLAAWAGALCFAVHPLQVEAVAWIGETRGLLAALFSLTALCWYLPRRSVALDSSSVAGADRFSTWRYILASAAFALALLSKPSAAALPLMALAIDLLWLRRSLRRSLACLAPWLALALLDIGLSKLLQADERITNRPDWWLRPLVAGDALAFYLRKLVMPLGLAFDYGRTPAVVLSSVARYWAWLAPACVLGLALISRRRRQWLTALGIFVAGLLPVLGFVPFLYQDISTVADRYLYLPMLGVALALAVWLDRHWSRPMFAITCLVLGAFGQIAWRQTSYWRDDLTVFSHGAEVNPTSSVAQYMLGTALARSGRAPEAQDHFRAAIKLNPRNVPAHNDLGAMLLEEGKTAAAQREIEAALAIDPGYPEAHSNLGNVFARLHRPERAVRQYRMALEQKPRLAEAHVNWGSLLLEQGRLAEATTHFRQAIHAQPRLAAGHFKLSEALRISGDLPRAEAELLAALHCDPKLAQAHNNLGAIYFRQHKLAAAAEQYEAALKLNPELLEALFNRGCIFIEQGDTARGLADFRATLRLLPVDSPQAAYIRGELKKYEHTPPAPPLDAAPN
ncbi:MAG TPA: tetratricopeptide repeat protein [Pirellulales bacterium]